jgi:hypothetical protein
MLRSHSPQEGNEQRISGTLIIGFIPTIQELEVGKAPTPNTANVSKIALEAMVYAIRAPANLLTISVAQYRSKLSTKSHFFVTRMGCSTLWTTSPTEKLRGKA